MCQILEKNWEVKESIIIDDDNRIEHYEGGKPVNVSGAFGRSDTNSRWTKDIWWTVMQTVSCPQLKILSTVIEAVPAQPPLEEALSSSQGKAGVATDHEFECSSAKLPIEHIPMPKWKEVKEFEGFEKAFEGNLKNVFFRGRSCSNLAQLTSQGTISLRGYICILIIVFHHCIARRRQLHVQRIPCAKSSQATYAAQSFISILSSSPNTISLSRLDKASTKLKWSAICPSHGLKHRSFHPSRLPHFHGVSRHSIVSPTHRDSLLPSCKAQCHLLLSRAIQ